VTTPAAAASANSLSSSNPLFASVLQGSRNVSQATTFPGVGTLPETTVTSAAAAASSSGNSSLSSNPLFASVLQGSRNANHSTIPGVAVPEPTPLPSTGSMQPMQEDGDDDEEGDAALHRWIDRMAAEEE
jgi:hypothetical protein